ncbi:GNAT family N-acetyltransferase [Erythrobacter sp. NFXS35]|uniref:GNAT family N-acetyltransferase n=1 Tax=Erythrobacter sp. NFXS35 TaxID=2818436 RepID=UPI0032E03569
MIRTPRLLLRKVRPAEDFAAMHAILANPQAMAFWSSLPHESEDQSLDWLADMAAIPPAEGADFIVEYQGQPIGKAGFYRFPEIGFLFAPDVWGQGFASEAIYAVLANGFAEHGLEGALADVDPRNAASLRLLARLGFAETRRAERTWLIGDQWCDSVYLSVSREVWLARTA